MTTSIKEAAQRETGSRDLAAMDVTLDVLEETALNPKQFGAVGDGVADDFTAITNCFAAALTLGVSVYFRPGTYKISQAIIIDGFTNVSIYAVGNVKILFPSADQTLADDTPGYDANASNARSAFYIKHCTDLAIRDLHFEGNSTEVDIQKNTGLAVACGLAVTGLNMLRITQRYGAGLVTQRDDADSKDALIEACRSYGSRLNSRLGNGGTFLKCTFELPATADYNRIGNHGSSHAIYQFASAGDDVSVKNCRFVNIRMDCVKVSGSASPSYGYSIEDCTFINCGRNHDGTIMGGGTSTAACVAVGADDNVVHAQISIQNNRVRSCGAFAAILGSKNVQVVGNQIHHTAALPTTLFSMISIARYTATSEPVEDIVCTGNHFTSEVASGTTFGTHAIELTRVGLGLAGRSSFPGVQNNHIGNGYTQGITATDCLNPVVEGNGFVGLATAMVLVGCRMPRIIRNDVIDQRSNNAQIRMGFCSWPILAANIGCGGRLLTAQNGKPTTGDNNNGSAPVVFPLAGFYGRVQATGLRPEVVFAYGSGWTDGDIVDFNGNRTFSYKADSPGVNQFDSIDGLIALLHGLSGFGAADYGAPWNIITNHIRVRTDRPTALANAFAIRTVCKNPTAGVMLRNSSLSTGDWSFARGEGSSGDRAVIWSPCLGMGEVPRLAPENAAAATALATVPYPVVTNAEEEAFADAVLQLPALSGTELFYWSVG